MYAVQNQSPNFNITLHDPIRFLSSVFLHGWKNCCRIISYLIEKIDTGLFRK